jgi:hypothetical protein
MSLATLLLAFLAPIVRPKPEAEKSAREAELEREVEELVFALKRAWAERDSARESLARMNRIEARRAPPAGFGQLTPQELNAVYQQQQSMHGLAQYQQQQSMQYQQQAAAHMLDICHCVPGRHEAMLGGVSGA